jgi:hypothetical protein
MEAAIVARMLGRDTRRSRLHEGADIEIRRARLEDAAALRRVAALDSKQLPTGDLLVAELDGELAAALPLDGGEPIADPFRPTAALVRLLELRREQIRHAGPPVAARKLGQQLPVPR